MEHLNGNLNDSVFGRFWVKGCKALALLHFNAVVQRSIPMDGLQK